MEELHAGGCFLMFSLLFYSMEPNGTCKKAGGSATWKPSYDGPWWVAPHVLMHGLEGDGLKAVRSVDELDVS